MWGGYPQGKKLINPPYPARVEKNSTHSCKITLKNHAGHGGFAGWEVFAHPYTYVSN